MKDDTPRIFTLVINLAVLIPAPSGPSLELSRVGLDYKEEVLLSVGNVQDERGGVYSSPLLYGVSRRRGGGVDAPPILFYLWHSFVGMDFAISKFVISNW